jgi:hypothetical protein
MKTEYPLGIEDDNFWRDYMIKNLLNKYLWKRIIYHVGDAHDIVYLSQLYDQNPEAFFKKINKTMEENRGLEKAIKKDYEQFQKTSMEMEKLMV